jgi:S1-C subfamily serine protease
MRRLDWIALLLIIAVALGGKILGDGGSVPENRSPRRPAPELFAPKIWDAETRAWLDQGEQAKHPGRQGAFPIPTVGVIEETDRRGSSTGSAFSVSSRGYWLTARHVVEGCDQAYLQTGIGEVILVQRTALHPTADVALIFTDGAPQGLPVAAARMGSRESFSVGFPQGQPGAVHGRFLGEMTMRHIGQRRYRERVYAWSIVSAIPRQFESLGGLSGGAVFDGAGRIIGIVQAEQPRRGRFMTARPRAYREILDLAGITVPVISQPASETVISEANYEASARRLITSLQVAKVLCRVG